MLSQLRVVRAFRSTLEEMEERRSVTSGGALHQHHPILRQSRSLHTTHVTVSMYEPGFKFHPQTDGATTLGGGSQPQQPRKHSSPDTSKISSTTPSPPPLQQEQNGSYINAALETSAESRRKLTTKSQSVGNLSTETSAAVIAGGESNSKVPLVVIHGASPKIPSRTMSSSDFDAKSDESFV